MELLAKNPHWVAIIILLPSYALLIGSCISLSFISPKIDGSQSENLELSELYNLFPRNFYF